jgi:hypothetical protein
LNERLGLEASSSSNWLTKFALDGLSEVEAKPLARFEREAVEGLK